MLLDERSLENECFGFIISDDKLDIGDLMDQLFGLDAVTEFAPPARLKIRTNAITQVLGFADIDDFPGVVLVQIHTRRARNLFQFFIQSHKNYEQQNLWKYLIASAQAKP